jgi:transcriptional regulator with XRE-family HTH domain
MSVVELLKIQRQRCGLTQRELATRSGIPQPVIAAYESGKREPKISAVERLAAHLDTELVCTPVVDVEAIFASDPLMRREAMLSLVLHHQVVVELLLDETRVRVLATNMLHRLRQNDRRRNAAGWFSEWQRLLEGDTATLIAAMLSRSSQAVDLRQVAPFAGVIDQGPRSEILRRVSAVRRAYRHAP